MRNSYAQAAVLVLLLSAESATGALAQSNTEQTAPDNTKTNKQNKPTADQQQENPADRQITQKIRHSVVQDKSLSTYAHNVKIITQNGDVTLKGPVNTPEEKQSIEDKAAAVAGQGHVTDQIEVAPPPK
jgi:osmotically-inducible protein OsmY